MTIVELEAVLTGVLREYHLHRREVVYGRFFNGRPSTDLVVHMARGEYMRRVFGLRAETRHVAEILGVTPRSVRRWRRELFMRGLIPKGYLNQNLTL